MSYSGAGQAKQVREVLGRALATLQLDPTIPPQAIEIASLMAQAVGSLFVAENAPDDDVGRQAVRASLGLLGQSLALMQQIQPPVEAVEAAMGNLAQAMGLLFPLTVAVEPATPAPAPTPSPASSPTSQSTPGNAPTTARPGAGTLGGRGHSTMVFAEIPAPPVVSITTSAVESPAKPPAEIAPQAQSVAASAAPEQAARPAAQPATPAWAQAALAPAAAPDKPVFTRAPGTPAPQAVAPVAHAAPQPKPYVAPAPVDTSGRPTLEANISLTTSANFWVGFEDEIAKGGVFVPTYEDLEPGTRVVVHVTLPHGNAFQSAAKVVFIRDPSGVDPTFEPGLGLRFEALAPEHREIARQFFARRPPLFYDLG